MPFEIPTSWQWCRLSNIANLYTGNSINESEKKSQYTDVIGTEYIATKDVGFDNSIDYKNGISIPEEYIEKFRIAPANSVLMCIEGGSAGRKIGILSQSVCFGNKLCCFSPYVDISEYADAKFTMLCDDALNASKIQSRLRGVQMGVKYSEAFTGHRIVGHVADYRLLP